MTSPISPSSVTAFCPDALPAYLSNGLIGLRVRQIPLQSGVAILNGCVGDHPLIHIDSTPFVPYPLSGDLRLEHTWLSDAPQQIIYEEQRYDFACGELHTRFRFLVNAVTAQVEILTFCSRSIPSLVLQEIRVQVDQPCDLTLRATVNPTGIDGTWHARASRLPGAGVDGSGRLEMRGNLSSCGVAYITELLGSDGSRRDLDEWGDQIPLSTAYVFHADVGRPYLLRQIASLVPSCYHHEPDWQATRLTYLGKERGFEVLREENRAAWAELWKGRVCLLGAEQRWQAMADAAFFYLHTSIHHSSPSSTTPFGLARWLNYHYYYGHVMWDLETFVVPPLLFTAPDAVHAMLTYRSDHLPAARAHAKLQGYQGLQFPWESSPLTGDEVAPPWSPGNVFEDHVTLDVAFAFAQYAHMTGDEEFQRQQAWPVLKGAAQWLESRVIRTPRGYELLRVTGIAETGRAVNNNAYTNMLASVILREACALARHLGRQASRYWEEIADHLVIPIDQCRHIILNHEGDISKEKESERATPEALAGLFPVGYRVEKQIEKATLAYYLPLAEKYYVGAPMLSPFFGVYAARLGDRDLSARLFERGYADFVFDPFCMTEEIGLHSPTRPPDRPLVGPFITNQGGFLMSCLYGLPGLRLGSGDPESWYEHRVVMPSGWQGIKVERIWIRGRPACLTAHHGDPHAQITFLDA